jgi:hypothetical protein
MTLNAATPQTLHSDTNALLRQTACTFPQGLAWRQTRSYMLVHNVTRLAPHKLQVSGYIRNNLLSAKRLLQLTGQKGVLKIESIQLGNDPCPLKISQAHKEKIMSSKAASKMTSKMASRLGSRKGSLSAGEENKPGRIIQQISDPKERDG